MMERNRVRSIKLDNNCWREANLSDFYIGLVEVNHFSYELTDS